MSIHEFSELLKTDDSAWKYVLKNAYNLKCTLRQDFEANFVGSSYKHFKDRVLKQCTSFTEWYSTPEVLKAQRTLSFTEEVREHRRNTDNLEETKERRRLARQASNSKLRDSLHETLRNHPELREQRILRLQALTAEKQASLQVLIEKISGYTPVTQPVTKGDFICNCKKHGDFKTHLLIGGGHVFGEVKACPCCTHTTALQQYLVELLLSKRITVLNSQWGKDSPFKGTLIEGQEIDILLPDLKIGIEVNGALTHNSGFNPYSSSKTGKPRFYHRAKTEEALNVGLRLFHIWEHWNRDIISSIVLSKLNIFNRRFYARSLSVTRTMHLTDELKQFMNNCHILGNTIFSVSFELRNGNEILQVMQFIIKGKDATLSRNASSLNTVVVGGFNKLLKHAINYLLSVGVKTITTYAIRDLTPDYKDSCYFRSGFSFCGDSGPTLSYFCYRTIYKDGNAIIKPRVYNRENFQKQKLVKLNGFNTKGSQEFKFDSSLSEQENLAKLQIYPLYNSGCWKFIKYIN